MNATVARELLKEMASIETTVASEIVRLLKFRATQALTKFEVRSIAVSKRPDHTKGSDVLVDTFQSEWDAIARVKSLREGQARSYPDKVGSEPWLYYYEKVSM